ncbi:MAG: type I-F CRISPR-associated protein Csy1 [Selenomonadaceae bacterium]|nr:type I-F CRISPR-associated protein Csy1 [Selenomonadaceae bacterium]
MSTLGDYIKEQAGSNNTQKWVNDILAHVSNCREATHVGKYTHSSTNGSISILDKSEERPQNRGYVCTATTKHKSDIAISDAKDLPAAKFLNLILEDGRKVSEHFTTGSDYLNELKQYVENFEEIKGKIVRAIAGAAPGETTGNIRQVYFPVGEGYHLLSLLTSSSVLYKMKAVIQQQESVSEKAKDSKNELYRKQYSLIKDLTAIKFGGTQPQNISSLNTKGGYEDIYAEELNNVTLRINPGGGFAYLLSSSPPIIAPRDIIIPRSDFFYNTLRRWQFRNEFDRLHAIFTKERNNAKIRKLRRELTADIIDKVMQFVYALRECEKDWSDREHNHLPRSQKIWLDKKYEEQRNQDDSWIEEVSTDFARWFFRTYEKLHKDDHVKMGQEEMLTIKAEVKEVLKYDRG